MPRRRVAVTLPLVFAPTQRAPKDLCAASVTVASSQLKGRPSADLRRRLRRAFSCKLPLSDMALSSAGQIDVDSDTSSLLSLTRSLEERLVRIEGSASLGLIALASLPTSSADSWLLGFLQLARSRLWRRHFRPSPISFSSLLPACPIAQSPLPLLTSISSVPRHQRGPIRSTTPSGPPSHTSVASSRTSSGTSPSEDSSTGPFTRLGAMPGRSTSALRRGKVNYYVLLRDQKRACLTFSGRSGLDLEHSTGQSVA